MPAGHRIQVCSVAPFVPFEGMAYAGADYYMRHLSALAQFADVTVVAPRSAGNEDARARYSGPAKIELVDPAPDAQARYFRLAAALYRRCTVITLGLSFVRPLVDAARGVERASIVELHFPNAVSLAGPISRSMPHARVVAIPHDVHSQGLARVMAKRVSAGRGRQLARRLFVRYVRRTEARHLNNADLVLVFSEKDSDLLTSSGVDSRIEVVPPALDEARMPQVASDYRPAGRSLLFVGALDREPNVDAVHWLIDDILPLVRARVPDATLSVAGGNASPALVERCTACPGVEVTGYVADLSHSYEAADVVVAPIRLGAGLKFKVGSAMLWGRPIVASAAAAEGYPEDQDLFVSITDDTDAFAGAVADVLKDPERGQATAARARKWAMGEFSTAKLEESLRTHYTRLT